jgi:DNA-binding transcriptional LysR family regulator
MTANSQVLDWAELQLLLAFGEKQSIMAAAKALGVDATTVARRLRNLERQLNLVLVVHEGKRLRLTEIGQEVLATARNMEDQADGLLRRIAASEPNAEGMVRLTALRSILRHVLMPSLPSLRERHPRIILALMADARNYAVGRREADIAIRLARPTGPDLAARKLFDVPFVVAGNTDQGWITYDESLSTLPEAQWVANNVAQRDTIMQANSMELIVEAVRAGLGCAILPKFLCNGLEHGSVELSREAWLVMHNETRNTPRIRAVADWVVEAANVFSKVVE